VSTRHAPLLRGESEPVRAPLAVLVLPRDGTVPAATRALLVAHPDVDLVEPGREVAREGGHLVRHPDVVVLSLDARAADAGPRVVTAVAQWRPVPLLVVTESEDRACNRRLVRAGARGVVTLARQSDHLARALHRIHEHEIWLARSCMSALIDEMVADDHPAPVHLTTREPLEELTGREREVVALIAHGMHNKAIASALGISDHTVRHHLTAIFSKLHVADRLELAVYAFRHHAPGTVD
jgi:DNA-binding NarL/FixJ family response regulator